MNINHKQKSIEKLLKKSAKSVFMAFLAFFAVVAGIQAGNLWYKLDIHVIDNIDPNSFKNIISFSIPIVETVYNSGKSSVSFSGEVKELFTRVFGIDLDTPASIFNAQSPIFRSYYRIRTMREQGMDDNALSGNKTALDMGNSDGGTGDGSGSSGTGSGSGTDSTGGGSSGDGVDSGNGGSGTGNGNSGSNTGRDSNDGGTSSQNSDGSMGNGSGDGGTGNENNGSGTGSGSGGTGTGGSTGSGNNGSGTDGGSGSTGSGNNGSGSGNNGNGKGSDGANKDQNGNGLYVGELDGTPESSMSFGTEYAVGQNSDMIGQSNNGTGQTNSSTGQQNQGSQGSQQQTGNTGGNNQLALGGQPISSVSYEIEDDKEGEEKETVELDKIQIKNYTKHKIDIAKLLKEPLKINLSKKGPKVLIYHTHTTESYVLKEADLGKKDVPSFNSNPKYNVVRVGEELARNLEKYGIDTLHNGTVHDKVHDAAYGASINTLQSYKKSYPSIQVYIDIHRDAVDESKPKLRMTKEINGKNCAQIMFVVGADGMLPHPEWKENLKFVLKLQQKLGEKYPGLAKPVRIVAKRYNQQISNNAILIEVGGDGNLLSECIESTKYLAEVLNDVMKGE